MRYSLLFGKTFREKPRNADALSHQLLLRGGFLRPAAGGGFLLLPLGERVMGKMAAMVRKEVRAVGFQALGLPPAANSDISRTLRLRRRDSLGDYPFADAHEAALAALAGGLGLSPRDLPLLLAGERWANRADAHPNWGLLAGPELRFHSAYAFCATNEDAAERLERVRQAYLRALEKAGVATFTLESEPATAELAMETGVAARPLLACNGCGYRGEVETAVSRAPEWAQDGEPGAVEAVYGPGLIQVEPLSAFLGIPVHQTTKTLLFEAEGRMVAASVAGVYDVSEAKLARILNCRSLGLAPAEKVRELTNADVGYAGPLGLPPEVKVIWDHSTERRTNFEAGANRTDHHLVNLNFGRDLPRPEQFFDIRVARAGERCARCAEGVLEARRAITLGHTTRLGATYADVLGTASSVGCGGLDLTAAMAAVVEQNHDSRGIVWPSTVAPFAAHLVSLPPAEEEAHSLYRRLIIAGVDILWDDRAESAGVKFGDADLIGIPIRLVLSKRTGEKVEWKARGAEQGELMDQEEAIERLSHPDYAGR